MHGRGPLKVGGRSGFRVEARDGRPMMADRAVLKATASEPDRLQRASRYPDRRKQMSRPTAHRPIKALAPARTRGLALRHVLTTLLARRGSTAGDAACDSARSDEARSGRPWAAQRTHGAHGRSWRMTSHSRPGLTHEAPPAPHAERLQAWIRRRARPCGEVWHQARRTGIPALWGDTSYARVARPVARCLPQSAVADYGTRTVQGLLAARHMRQPRRFREGWPGWTRACDLPIIGALTAGVTASSPPLCNPSTSVSATILWMSHIRPR